MTQLELSTIQVNVVREYDDEAPMSVAVASRLGVDPKHIADCRIVRRALDARRRLPRPVWRLTVEVDLLGPVPASAEVEPPRAPSSRLASPRASADSPPIVIVGAGPAGLFAAWHLAEHGARVTLLERGKPVETRARDCGRFRAKGELDTESNLCFGEGGAGTYSDGKLTTRKKDPLVREVLERLVEAGAPERILIDAKPHIGTNLLFGVLRTIRAALLGHGVDVQFQTRMDDLSFRDGRVQSVTTTAGIVDAGRVLLATGHSARDTFERLLAAGLPIEAKPFAVGVRAEHPQALIDEAQYRLGVARPTTLPAADYRLSHTEAGRGVYSFCMCPGGMVVPTATEPESVVVNGMSTARRSSPFANSGVVVQVELQDMPPGPLGGVQFQRQLERAAYIAGGGKFFSPAMTASDFVAKRASGILAATHFRPGLTPYDLRALLPKFVVDGLAAGLTRFDRQLHGYASSQANLIAAETRTSSPIRIARDKTTCEVPGFSGLYVAGEGPGYAGGIMSAAVDGLRVAHQILNSM